MAALFLQAGVHSRFSPPWKAGNPIVTDMYKNHSLNDYFYWIKKIYTRTEASLWPLDHPGGTRHQPSCPVSLGPEKLCTFRTHAYQQDLVNWILSFSSSLKNTLIICSVTYSPVFLAYLIVVFKVIGLNCTLPLIHSWESIPKEKAFWRRMFITALFTLKSGEVKCATKGILKLLWYTNSGDH